MSLGALLQARAVVRFAAASVVRGRHSCGSNVPKGETHLTTANAENRPSQAKQAIKVADEHP
jgi:hypothetical protein